MESKCERENAAWHGNGMAWHGTRVIFSSLKQAVAYTYTIRGIHVHRQRHTFPSKHPFIYSKRPFIRRVRCGARLHKVSTLGNQQNWIARLLNVSVMARAFSLSHFFSSIFMWIHSKKPRKYTIYPNWVAAAAAVATVQTIEKMWEAEMLSPTWLNHSVYVWHCHTQYRNICVPLPSRYHFWNIHAVGKQVNFGTKYERERKNKQQNKLTQQQHKKKTKHSTSKGQCDSTNTHINNKLAADIRNG